MYTIDNRYQAKRWTFDDRLVRVSLWADEAEEGYCCPDYYNYHDVFVQFDVLFVESS
jgi:hypothetical protein